MDADVEVEPHDFDDDPWENPAECLRESLDELFRTSTHPDLLAVGAHAELALRKLLKERDDAVRAATWMWTSASHAASDQPRARGVLSAAAACDR